MEGAFVSAGGVVRDAVSRRRAVCARGGERRGVVVMKKVRRGEEDAGNAVDVFGGGSQEELLKAALGGDEAEVGMKEKVKKGKKGKKKGIVEDEGNAVDVFGGGAPADVLLAEALGDEEKGENGLVKGNLGNNQKKGGKKGRGKKATAGAEDDNAVDVFAGSSMSAEELLADALGHSNPEEAAKKTVVEGIEANAKGQATKRGKGKKKGLTGPAVSGDTNIEDEGDAVDAFPDVDRSASELLTEVIGEGAPVGTADDDDDDESVLLVEDDFEPEEEVVNEFEAFSSDVVAFTAAGRREKLKSQRGDRNEQETRFVDPKRAGFGSGGEKFTSIRLEDVTVTFRNTTVLNGVTWGVKTGERVGLIGENGCGKTTQLKIIAGSLEPTSGEVVRASSRTKASFLRQEFVDELDQTRTLREEFLAAFTEESKALAAYKQTEQDIEAAGGDLEKLEVLLNRMEELRQKCDDMDAWNLDGRIDRVMPGLGFLEEDNDKLVASFSGGWKVRIGLGKVLLQDPDLLLLDEPSNHLDNESVEWLEEYLRTCSLPMVVVSHDREFLDRVCTKIVEIEGGEAFEYPGNYSRFGKLKAEQRKAWEAAYDRQQKFVKEQQIYIKRNRRSPARSSQVKSRQKMLDRMERTGQMVRRPPRVGKPLVFRFPPAPRSGRDVILVDGVTHGYEGQTLFDDAAIAVERGDRIALIGPNGCGKSTLLRMITGREQPQSGAVECDGLHNVKLAYYEQNQADALDLAVTVLDTLRQSAPSDMRYEDIRALLGKFLFKGDDVEKKVQALSGGEKARLALAKIMLEPANVLVLDEPGNHLSISAKEMLEEALQHFDGTLLLVSHDRYLISQVATQILAVENKELVLYDGDYKAYMEKNDALRKKLEARFIPGVAEIKSAPKVVIEEPTVVADTKKKRKRNFGGSGINSGKTKEMNAKRWS